ncbi:MAG: hypothetical protein H8E34_13790 [Bacteroidetes bacterium]|nr:hypothetical protein [Bacteroidota bacterium]MBL7003015.1 hypothetical protein [Gammaproteobacteria bacterium]
MHKLIVLSITVFLVSAFIQGCDNVDLDKTDTCCCYNHKTNSYQPDCKIKTCAENPDKCFCSGPYMCTCTYNSDFCTDDKNSGLEKFYNAYSIAKIYLSHQWSNIKVSNKGLSCLDECFNPKSPFCLRVEKEIDPSGIIESIKDTGTLFINEESLIKKTVVMDNFNIDNDPCNRSDIDLDDVNGRIYAINTGKLCSFANKFTVIGDISLTLSIDIPEKIMAEKISKNDVIEYIFHNPLFSPHINFGEDEGFTKDYGGIVKKVTFTNKGQVLESASNSCIGLIY